MTLQGLERSCEQRSLGKLYNFVWGSPQFLQVQLDLSEDLLPGSHGLCTISQPVFHRVDLVIITPFTFVAD